MGIPRLERLWHTVAIIIQRSVPAPIAAPTASPPETAHRYQCAGVVPGRFQAKVLRYLDLACRDLQIPRPTLDYFEPYRPGGEEVFSQPEEIFGLTNRVVYEKAPKLNAPEPVWIRCDKPLSDHDIPGW